jgi:hypothetical protein
MNFTVYLERDVNQIIKLESNHSEKLEITAKKSLQGTEREITGGS